MNNLLLWTHVILNCVCMKAKVGVNCQEEFPSFSVA